MLEKRNKLFDLIKREILKQLGTNLPIGKVIETNKINHSGFSLQDIYDGLDYLQEKKLLKYYGMAQKRFILMADGVDWVTGIIELPKLPSKSSIQYKFWSNPWVIGIGAPIVVAMILGLISLAN